MSTLIIERTRGGGGGERLSSRKSPSTQVPSGALASYTDPRRIGRLCIKARPLVFNPLPRSRLLPRLLFRSSSHPAPPRAGLFPLASFFVFFFIAGFGPLLRLVPPLVRSVHVPSRLSCPAAAPCAEPLSVPADCHTDPPSAGVPLQPVVAPGTYGDASRATLSFSSGTRGAVIPGGGRSQSLRGRVGSAFHLGQSSRGEGRLPNSWPMPRSSCCTHRVVKSFGRARYFARTSWGRQLHLRHLAW